MSSANIVRERFADEPGNWAYFSTSIGARESDYPETMAAPPTEACNSCHEANGGRDSMFSQFYPILKAAKSKWSGLQARSIVDAKNSCPKLGTTRNGGRLEN